MVQVHLTPSVLTWAIDRSGYGVEDVARAAGTKPENVHGWVSGTGTPTLRQALLAAEKLEIAFPTLLLPAPPAEAPPQLLDYRGPGNPHYGSQSPPLRSAIRKALFRRQALVDLEDGAAEASAAPLDVLSGQAPPGAARVRWLVKQITALLDLPLKGKVPTGNPSKAFKFLRLQCEAAGALVFQTRATDLEEMGGVSIHMPTLPVILVNESDGDSRRVFTLAHEMAHLLIGGSALCIPQANRKIRSMQSLERDCDKASALALMPKSSVIDSGTALLAKGMPTRDIAVRLANLFNVSRPAMTIRMKNLDLIEEGVADDLLRLFADEFSQRQIVKKAQSRQGDYRRDPGGESARWTSPRLMRAVRDSLEDGDIDAMSAASILGIRSSKIDRAFSQSGLDQ